MIWWRHDKETLSVLLARVFFAVISLLLVANTLTNNDLLSVGPQWTESIISLYLSKNRKKILYFKQNAVANVVWKIQGSVGNTCTSTCDDLFK